MKNKFSVIVILSIISSFSFLGITAHAEGSSSKVVTQYIMYDDLNPTEKDTLIQEQPSINVSHDQENIKLVYKQVIDKSMSHGSNNKVNLSLNLLATSTTKGSLPKTGENNPTMYWIIGVLLTVCTLSLFIWRRKNIKTLFVFWILAMGFSYSQIANAAETSLPKESVQNLAKNETVYSPNVTVYNYEYVGYIYTYSDNEKAIQTGSVTV
ncbi:LPXTG cell wall anchor domain-containing protein, partial [Enterococcus faecalis]|uniref:LPXTG cell wall anchor domain-containing protein n=1 Tax=Enterococcus faecalis TaxID=1351 RepID=UPI00035481B2